ncbi:hypothetical protein GCM10010254_05360 [Streptomyces chromofuscus]|uniref:hypothetical protein n=1 Tax=Streptomyces chromofuscus TaxID=42881 RepID=UPI00199BC51F|nr:hypothetical protein GCM10010254_05360 [Streptomyces chromofuscus]
MYATDASSADGTELLGHAEMRRYVTAVVDALDGVGYPPDEQGDEARGTALHWTADGAGLDGGPRTHGLVVFWRMTDGWHCAPPEARWLRFARVHLAAESPYLPGQSGYNKRLRAANTLISRFIRTHARDSDLWHDDGWIVNSTPVECARSRPPSNAPTWPAGPDTATALALPVLLGPAPAPDVHARRATDRLGLANPKADEREVLADMLTGDPDLLTTHPGQSIVGDKGYVSKHLDAFMALLCRNGLRIRLVLLSGRLKAAVDRRETLAPDPRSGGPAPHGLPRNYSLTSTASPTAIAPPVVESPL